jgi:pilus assembly protein Flp/PilA
MQSPAKASLVSRRFDGPGRRCDKDRDGPGSRWNDESGASAAEYALILAIVGTGIAAAAIGLGNAISNSMNTAAAKVANPAS